jgi:hypothetical protein
MAKTLRSVVTRAREGASGWSNKIGLSSGVAEATDELGRLAEALEQPAPVCAQGAARAWLLLTDGTGPLYNAQSRESIRSSAAAAVAGLRLR